MSWFPFHFWRLNLLNIEIFADIFFLPALQVCYCTDFWPPWFLMRNWLLTLLRIPCVWWVTFLLLLSKFYLSLSFNNFILMCLSVDLFEFILLGTCWASWKNLKFRKFLAIIFQILFLLLSLLSCNSHYVYVGIPNGVPQVS